MHLLYVQGVPGHVLLGELTVLVESTRINALLGLFAGGVQEEASEERDLRVDAEVVTGADHKGTGVVGRVHQLFLHLSQLRVGAGGVYDAGHV